MTVVKVLINLFATIVELFIVKDLYSIFANKKRCNLQVTFIVGIVYLIYSVIATLYINSIIIMLIGNCVVLSLLSFGYEIKIKQVFFVLIIYVAVGMAFEMLIGLTYSLILKTNIEQIQNKQEVYLQATLISKFSFYIFVKIIKTFLKQNKNKLDNKKLLLFAPVPIATIFVLFFQSYFVYNSNNFTLTILVILSTVILISANIATLRIYEYVLYEVNKNKEIELRASAIEIEVKYYEQFVNAQIQSNKTIHDVKHKIFEINEYLKTNNPLGAKEIEKICGDISNANMIKYTGVNGIDVLLNVKKTEMLQKNIKFSINTFVLEHNNVENIDLCVILGNLFDNAIEACDKKDDDRFVQCDITQCGGYLSIKIDNSCVDTMAQTNITTKNDKNLHGLGLKNVKAIARKYNGEVNFEKANNLFSIIVLLQNI